MITLSINWIRLRLMLPKSRWKWLKSRWQWLKIGRCFERLRPDLMRWNMQSWNLLHHTLISHFRNHMVNSHINVHTRYASYTCIKIQTSYLIFLLHIPTLIYLVPVFDKCLRVLDNRTNTIVNHWNIMRVIKEKLQHTAGRRTSMMKVFE